VGNEAEPRFSGGALVFEAGPGLRKGFLGLAIFALRTLLRWFWISNWDWYFSLSFLLRGAALGVDKGGVGIMVAGGEGADFISACNSAGEKLFSM